MRIQSLFLSLCLSVCLPVGAAGVDVKNKSITIALSNEPPDMKTMTSTDTVSRLVLEHVMEGLLIYEPGDQIKPGVAERWEVEGTRAVFYLRKNALWSDGEPVTAHDFVFAWRKVLEPKTASQYSFMLYPLKNGRPINEGKMPTSALGVKALDDYTLEVELEQPTPYFLKLLPFNTYYPVRESFYNKVGERYAADADEMLYNGAFTIESWVHGASLMLKKNPKYWNKDRIQLNEIRIPYITSDPNSVFNLFRDGELALSGLNAETLKFALQQRMYINRFSEGVIFYMELNHRPGRITRNHNFRKALQSVYEPQALVNKIIGIPGYYPAYSLFPRWIDGVKDKFYREYPAPRPEISQEKAMAYLAAAKKELGIKEFEPISLLIGDSPDALKQAEYLQDLLSRNLGLKVKIDVQTFKQRLEKMTSGDFDIVMAGWGPDYNDMLTFADLFTSYNENNRGRYRSAEYDRLVEAMQHKTDPQIRADTLAQIQQLIFDDVVILPQYERGLIYVQSTKLKGVFRSVFGGDPNYKFAEIVDE